MPGSRNVRILAGRPAVNFVGRSAEAERLFSFATSASDGEGLVILATPGAGASELLRQTYDRLFHEQRETIPFYFSVRRSFKNSRELAEGFLTEFIRQLVSFRRHDPSIERSAAGLDELAELSLSVSGIWIDRLISSAQHSSDERTFLRSSFSAPVRAMAHGEETFVMIDDAHRLLDLDDGEVVLDELKDVLENAGVRFVVSGYRRAIHGRFEGRRLALDNFGFREAGPLVEVFAAEAGVNVSEQSRDLIATQLGGNASMTRRFMRQAADSGLQLDNFDNVEKAYADGLFGGRIGSELDEILATICRTPEVARNVISLLFRIQANEMRRLDRGLWPRRLLLSGDEAESLLERLNVHEIIRVTPNTVESVTDNLVLTDYIAARHRLTESESRASVFGDSLTGYIKRAPELLARRYRSNWSAGVREVLGAFDGRRVASVLINYEEFRDEIKGLPDGEILASIGDGPQLTLPRIFFTTAASAFYRPISQIAESERSAIALGFEASDADANDEVVWIAAEIDSKLEASRELAEFWCDRLEAAAVMCDFSRSKIWLVAPEGFSPAALEVLKARGAYGSSRRQIDLLRQTLGAPPPDREHIAANEYEIVIPMDEDAELIAAHAVEEIARRHKLDARSVNQIKTALVEACINAAEHSLSPDRKIYQRFRIEDDRVVLTVSNRGLRLTSRSIPTEPTEGRRGWGLNLMRKLMDEVRIEQVDDGTRIVMTKYLRAAA